MPSLPEHGGPPRSLRRRADRPGLSRRQLAKGKLPPELLAATSRGGLTKANTRPGTQGRQAVDRVKGYSPRVARHPELTARQAAGHEAPSDVLPVVTFFAVLGAAPTVLADVTVSRRDVRRVARYLGLVGQLSEGRISPEAFERRVASWRPVTILDPPGFRGQVRFLSDPQAAQFLSEIERGEERESWIDSGRKRPSPRRRR
ncbi:MAG: hypothetical protein ACLPQS_04175 [Acidimicrobiales bacterium]